MRVSEKVIEGKANYIRYTHIEMESERICFMFSGSGYTYDKPLFYYATMTMLENSIDIVHIHYKYETDFLKRPIEEITSAMMDDIDPVLKEVHSSRSYKEIFLIGKSLGTIPIACSLLKKEEFSQAKAVLLTPLLNFKSVFDGILTSRQQSLLVIGDKDPHYRSEKMAQLNTAAIKTEVVARANHHLDAGKFETRHSIEVLSRVMELIEDML